MKKIYVSNYYYLTNNKTINKEDIDVGATLFDGKWKTNHTESSEINVQKNNKISIYVPSTIDVNKVNENFENTLNYFISLANQFKKDLSQEGISIGINNGLLII